MKRFTIFLLVNCLSSLFFRHEVSAQGWFPPVSISSGTDMCDDTPYKMVFNDDFNGSTLSSQWLTYFSWSGMPGGDNENWEEARFPHPFNSIKRTQNIHLEDGICSLFLKHEPGVSWKCDTCPTLHTKNLSSAVIATRFRNAANTADVGYNSGKFEAKLRFPTFNGSWCAFWLQYGSQVDEIDIAETYGGGASAPLFLFERTRASHVTYSWKPDPNPYSMPDKYVLGYQYPKQTWFDWFIRRNFKQDLFHVYTCEWDTARILTYLDGKLVNTRWKYYTDFGFGGFTFRFPSTCLTPLSVPYNISKGFPYNNNSNCQLRLESKFEEDFDESGLSGGTYTMGSMDIDYVRIWQRHPEADNHTEICNSSAVITGPDTLCGNNSYSVPIALEGKGNWSFSNDAMTIYSGPSGCCHYSYVMAPAPSEYNSCVLSFTYDLPGCPTQTISKNVVINKVTPSPTIVTLVSTSWGSPFRSLHLAATRDIPGATYQWTINYGLNASSLTTLHTTGRVVETPMFISDGRYYASWALTITSTCNSITQGGISQWAGFGFRPLSATVNQDSTIYSLNAHFNTPSDTANYNQAVRNRISQIYIENTDTNKLRQIINQVRFEELAPYVVFGQQQQLQERPNEQLEETYNKQTGTLVFPNPTNADISVIMDAGYNVGEPVTITLFDMVGRALKSKTLICSTVIQPFSLTDLPQGIYLIKIQQSERTEHFKVVKSNQK